jgi:hypothetical protein
VQFRPEAISPQDPSRRIVHGGPPRANEACRHNATAAKGSAAPTSDCRYEPTVAVHCKPSCMEGHARQSFKLWNRVFSHSVKQPGAIVLEGQSSRSYRRKRTAVDLHARQTPARGANLAGRGGRPCGQTTPPYIPTEPGTTSRTLRTARAQLCDFPPRKFGAHRRLSRTFLYKRSGISGRIRTRFSGVRSHSAFGAILQHSISPKARSNGRSSAATPPKRNPTWPGGVATARFEPPLLIYPPSQELHRSRCGRLARSFAIFRRRNLVRVGDQAACFYINYQESRTVSRPNFSHTTRRSSTRRVPETDLTATTAGK